MVIAAVIELVDFASLRRLYRISTSRLAAIYGHATRVDFIGAVGALFGVLVFDTLPGLVIGVVLSLLTLIYRASRPHVAVLGRVPGAPGQWSDMERHPENRQADEVVVARVESGLFFANADTGGGRLRGLAEAAGVRALVLDAATIPVVDTTAAAMLHDLATDLEQRGVHVMVVGDVGQVLDVLRRTGTARVLAQPYPSIEAATAAALGDGSPAGAAGGDATGRATVRPDELEGEQE